ncbi:MAG: hypothetical protein Q9217_001295 [Psora testacea]
MPRRLSGPTEDTDTPQKDRLGHTHNGEKGSFTSAKDEVKRESDSLDRRILEKSLSLAHSSPNGPILPPGITQETLNRPLHLGEEESLDKMAKRRNWRRLRTRNPWSLSLPMLVTTAIALILLLFIVHAFVTRQLDPKGCDMCWSRPIYIKFSDFDTEHTRFASKYSLYMLREGGFDEDPKARNPTVEDTGVYIAEADWPQVKGVPILFIPGNAGSFKQARCLEFEAAQYYHNVIQQDPDALKRGVTSLDFFAVDFNEDFSAFHGQTLLDQAEFVNDAVAYILSLYHDPRRLQRDLSLPDPSSVILIGHSMGGVVARTMLTMANYQSNSINTIVTMSTPHARPPVSVDSDLVHAYGKVNEYWRKAYLQKWANDNPLWHVTLVSIAGGGLDTVVPSDFASLESLVPNTHGFTVFTSGIPNVWSGCDHIQTTWCVQLMKAIARSIFETLDVHRPSQTKPRAERMRIFKRWYLTGMEDIVEKALHQQEASTLVPLEKDSNSVLLLGERLVLKGLGHSEKFKVYLLPVPPQPSLDTKSFTFLSDQPLQKDGGPLEVLFCGVFPTQPGHSAALLSMSLDLSGETPGSSRLACKSSSLDAISLPASRRVSNHPFDKDEPFSYLHYSGHDLADYQFVAVVDKGTEAQRGWAVAEFSDSVRSIIATNNGLRSLSIFGLHVKLPAERPLVAELQVPALHSSLLAFNLHLGPQACGDDIELFTPLLRQHLEEPFESKFFVNVKDANVSLHGIAPFMPPPLRCQGANNGLSLQFWSDPTCNSSIEVAMKIDFAGSMGKLVMRYRLVFAAFPLLVVALVLRNQFKVYDETGTYILTPHLQLLAHRKAGTFITFAESLDLCLRSSLPLLILALSVFAISLAASSTASPGVQSRGPFGLRGNATETALDFTKNDLLLGSQDPIFWFLVPLFGLISVGVCILVNYAALGVTHLFYLPYHYLTARPSWVRMEDIGGRSIAPAFSASSPRRRLITTCILLFFVSTLIPYQFAFLDAVFVQLLTCTRALRLVRASNSPTHHNFYNYTHSIFVLMLWVLPINLPVLVVWVHNLAVHWLTPFSSHHNIISIMPYLILVETLTSGRMIPRLNGSWGRHITNVSFFALSVWAAVYGISYAYVLHHFVNGICAWLVAVHNWGRGGMGLKEMREVLDGDGDGGGGDIKKQP